MSHFTPRPPLETAAVTAQLAAAMAQWSANGQDTHRVVGARQSRRNRGREYGDRERVERDGGRIGTKCDLVYTRSRSDLYQVTKFSSTVETPHT